MSAYRIFFFAARIGEFSDDEEEFSSNDEGSDSEPMLEDRRVRKDSIQPSTVRVSLLIIDEVVSEF